MRNLYSAAEIEYLKTAFYNTPFDEMVKHLNRTRESIKCVAQRLGLKRANQHKQFSADEIQYIKENYANTRTDKMALHLKRTKSSIFGIVGKLGLNKSEEFMKSAESGIFIKGTCAPGAEKFWFPKGHVPANKGKKGYHAPGSEKGWFKKGNVSPNTKYDGCISKRLHKRTQVIYLYIRLSKGNWQLLHQYNWEQVNDKLLPGQVLRFKDGNTQNCDILNLELIDQKENMIRNSIHNYPEDIKSTIRTLSKLKKTIKDYEKHTNN